jgi:hypothetical protein
MNECGNRERIADLSVARNLNLVYEVFKNLVVAGNGRHTHSGVLSVLPSFGNLNLNNLLIAGVDSVVVHLNDSFTLLGIRSGSSVLHILNSFFDRNDVGKLEECRLENSVDSVAKTDFLTDLNAVDDVELDVVLSDISLNLSGEVLVEVFLSPLAVEKECSARLDVGNHVILRDIGLVMASYEISLVDKVCRLDRSLTES